MEESDQRRLGEAVAFALEAHAGQSRKGTEIPYVSHLFQVAGLVMEAEGDTTQAVAALLHDALEDCEAVETGTLVAKFGPEVAQLVEACSDLRPGDSPEKKSPWVERKLGFLEKIREAGPRAQRICACDKLHNLRSLVADLRVHGLPTLERFNAEAGQIRWYYETAHEITAATLTAPLNCEFEAALASLAEFVPESKPPSNASR